RRHRLHDDTERLAAIPKDGADIQLVRRNSVHDNSCRSGFDEARNRRGSDAPAGKRACAATFSRRRDRTSSTVIAAVAKSVAMEATRTSPPSKQINAGKTKLLPRSGFA